MKPYRFAVADAKLEPPPGRDDVGPLWIARDYEHECCISAWKPSWREVLHLLIGRPVWLWVDSGETQPPVLLTTENPWKRREGESDG